MASFFVKTRLRLRMLLLPDLGISWLHSWSTWAPHRICEQASSRRKMEYFEGEWARAQNGVLWGWWNLGIFDLKYGYRKKWDVVKTFPTTQNIFSCIKTITIYLTFFPHGVLGYSWIRCGLIRGQTSDIYCLTWCTRKQILATAV